MFNRRLLMFLGFVAAAMVVGVLRLGQLQLVRGAKYAAEAERQLISGRRLHTYRGDILDRHGRILATDKACFELVVEYPALLLDQCRRRRQGLIAREGLSAAAAARHVTEEVVAAGEYSLLRWWVRSWGRRNDFTEAAAWTALAERVDQMLDRAATISGDPRDRINRTVDDIVRRVQRIRRSVGSPVAEETRSHTVLGALGEAAAVELRAEADRMIAASVEAGTRRWYPYGDLACHVIGRQGRVTTETLLADPHADDPLLEYLPSEHVGVSGAERTCEAVLRGVRGLQQTRADDGEVNRTAPIGGESVRLTLDIELQRQVTRLLLGVPYNGAAVILHVPTGEILALVSKPTYDLNTYGRRFRYLADDEVNLPLLHRAVARGYAPGSTIKPVTALAGLAEKLITPATTFTCRGHADPRRPRCWSKVGHGPMALSEAIMNSCNSYFCRTAERLGVDRLTYWFRQFGMGAEPGTGLPGESGGIVPTRRWLYERHHRVFYPGDVRCMAIGQGPILATPLQVANATATIARDGVWLSPVLIFNLADRQQRRELDLPAGAAALVRDGMYRVVNDPASQTAYKYATRSGPVLCGKTGTAQTNRPGRNMAWFTGFSPRRDPQIALAIVLEHAGGGGPNCVPLADKAVALCKDLGYLTD